MSRVSRTLRITKKIVTYAFVLLIVFINAILIWRIFSTSLPDSMKALSPNEALASAYENSGGKLDDAFRQEQRSQTSVKNEEKDNYGLFSIKRATIIPSANQIQIVFCYNNGTLKRTQEDYGLSEVPSRDAEVYDVSLFVVLDKTPGNTEDNFDMTDEAVNTVRLKPSYFEVAQTEIYNYRLFVFDFGELDLSALVESGELLSIFTDIYYDDGAIDYESESYGTLCIYDYITEIEPVKLSSADKKAIEAFIEKKK